MGAGLLDVAGDEGRHPKILQQVARSEALESS